MAIRDKRTDPREMDIWVKADETHGETGLQLAVVYPESFCGKSLLEQVAGFCKEGYAASSIVPDWLLIDVYDIVSKSNSPDTEQLATRIIDATERIW
jgi:hypothetical protein